MYLLETRSGGGSEKEDEEERKGIWEGWGTVIRTNLWKAIVGPIAGKIPGAGLV